MLTAVIGASALIKNSLWVYLRSVTVDLCPPRGDESGGSLKAIFLKISLKENSTNIYFSTILNGRFFFRSPINSIMK